MSLVTSSVSVFLLSSSERTPVSQRNQVRCIVGTTNASRGWHQYLVGNRCRDKSYSTTPSRSHHPAGHYAGKSWSTTHPRRPMLLRAADRHKDQTYYLSSISEQSLARSFFPLATLSKIQVRELAHKFELPTANREESMGICFVGEKRKFSNFLCASLSLSCAIVSLVLLDSPVHLTESWTYHQFVHW